MQIHKFAIASLVAASLGISMEAAAVNPCIPSIPSVVNGSTGNVQCGTLPGPTTVGLAKWSTSTQLSYAINLVSGISASGLPVLSDGQSQVPKSGGGFCPRATDQSPGGGSAGGFCTTVTAFAAKRYRITVG